MHSAKAFADAGAPRMLDATSSLICSWVHERADRATTVAADCGSLASVLAPSSFADTLAAGLSAGELVLWRLPDSAPMRTTIANTATMTYLVLVVMMLLSHPPRRDRSRRLRCPLIGSTSRPRIRPGSRARFRSSECRCGLNRSRLPVLWVPTAELASGRWLPGPARL